MSEDVLTTREVQAVFGLGSLSSARMQICRWRIEAVGRDVDSGMKSWPVSKIIEVAGDRTVAGRRVCDVIAEVIRGRGLPGGGTAQPAEATDEHDRLEEAPETAQTGTRHDL